MDALALRGNPFVVETRQKLTLVTRQRQRQAFEAIRQAVEAYDVECIDTLIGDIAPPTELMKTQTDRKIAAELRATCEAQREAQVRRQELERETSVANLQAEVVRSEQQVRIAERNATAHAESAKGEAAGQVVAESARRAQAHGDDFWQRLAARVYIDIARHVILL